MSILLLISVISCCAVFFGAVVLAIGIMKMGRLQDVDLATSDSTPLVSIIVPACNEEENIENGLLSLLAQDYPNFEVIVVDDRSTDNTAVLLKKIQKQHSRLKVHQVVELPEGWMGKSHALATGAELADGKYLVFTDADVIMEKTTIRKSVKHAEMNDLDHLTLMFKNITGGWLLNSLILDAGMGLLFTFRPWAAKENSSSAFVGIGAFNMIKRSIYKEIGGHERIKMHPIDDMMLGKLVKKHGYRQDCLMAYEFVEVPWYETVPAMVKGLEKNMFAVLHYRLLLVPAVLFIVVAVAIMPFWGAILADDALQAVCLLTIIIRLVVFYRGLQMQNRPAWHLVGALITPYISCYIILRSSISILLNRGILWRGQHYDIEEVKKSDPLIF